MDNRNNSGNYGELQITVETNVFVSQKCAMGLRLSFEVRFDVSAPPIVWKFKCESVCLMRVNLANYGFLFLKSKFGPIPQFGDFRSFTFLRSIFLEH